MTPARKQPAAAARTKSAAPSRTKSAAAARPKPAPPAPVAADEAPPLPRIPDGVLLGAHVSSQGGSFEAPPRAAEIGATAFQLFTKTPNQWKEREISDEEATRFREAVARANHPVTVSHDSYLINLASPEPTLRARSIASFAAELRRCTALGIDYLVSHPGNYIDDAETGMRRNADGITEAFEGIPAGTTLCLEATAGSGTALGRRFEELATILDAVPAPLRDRIGICLDTCHIWSAGYDIVADFDGVLRQFDATLGLDRLKVWHLNDSKTPFGSHRDRHELIGQGSIGDAPFARIMTDPRFRRIPKILETPKGDDATASDRRMIRHLLTLAGLDGTQPA